MWRPRRRIHPRPRPHGRSDSWCSPGSNSSAHFIIKGRAASRVFPATDMSYIRHKIMLTLCLTTPTLLVEQGFAGFLAAVLHCAMQRRSAPAATLHHAVPTQSRFRFAAIRLVRRLPKRAVCRSPHRAAATGANLPRFPPVVQVSGMAVLPQRAAQPRKITRPYANSEFRRVSQRFAERAYRMAFSLASNASSWRFLNG